MWNNLELECPSEDLSEYPPQDQYLIEELRNFVTVLSTAANTLTSENPLWTELQVLQDIQMKYKRMLRCDRSLIFLHRVGHCIKKMVLLNLSKSFLDLAERFLNQLQSNILIWHLPSRQQLEYLLIRTLTASKLVCQGIQYSRETFCYLIQKLKVGHLILDLVMAASLIARLNILLRATLEQLCSTYAQVIPWRYKLKQGKYVWSRKLDLPLDLGEWLKCAESESLEPFPMSGAGVDMLSTLLTAADDSEDSDSNSIIVVKEVIQVKDDCGEVIPRKKAEKQSQLTKEQNVLLKKVFSARSLEDLENIWCNIQDLPKSCFPKPLRERKKETINRKFAQIRSKVPKKKFSRKLKKGSKLVETPCLVLCKLLGFTPEDIKACKNDCPSSSETETASEGNSRASNEPETRESSSELEVNATKLVPVKTLKEMKELYNRLCEILKFTQEKKKHRKLRRVFERRRADIKLLRQNGEKVAAKKLIFCTSKLLLTYFSNYNP